MRGEWSSLAGVTPTETSISGDARSPRFSGRRRSGVVYLAGLRWGARTALLAAGLLAVMPLHVRESHYVLTDVPVTFLVMLTFLLSLRAHERATLGPFALAGAAAGLAAATKYNGGLAVLMPLIACAMTPGRPPVAAARVLCDHRRQPGGVPARGAVHVPRSADIPQPVRAAVVGLHASRLDRSQPRWLIYLKHLRNALALARAADDRRLG